MVSMKNFTRQDKPSIVLDSESFEALKFPGQPVRGRGGGGEVIFCRGTAGYDRESNGKEHGQ